MSDLIIKPTATSGNKLILQDQAGGAVLTTSDSGADYVGTTKGTIDSTATFPSGHIIQTVSEAITTTANSDNTSSNDLVLVEHGSNNYEWKKTITGVTSGNKVLVQMNFSWSGYKASNDVVGAGFGIYRSTATDGSGTTKIYETDGNGAGYIHLSSVTSTNYTMRVLCHLHFLDSSPSAGSNTYYLGYRTYATGTNMIYSAANYPPFMVTLQEIQA